MTWAPDYVDAAALVAYVRAADDDPYVASLGTAASRAADLYCNRQFGQLAAPATFTYSATRAARQLDGTWLLPIDDLMDATGLVVTVDATTVTAGATGYRLWPRNAAAKGQPYVAVQLADQPAGDVDVLAKFGWSAFPASLISAVRFQTNRWFVRRESPYGTAGSPAEGTAMNLAARLDPDVRTILAPLVRPRPPR